MDYLIMLAKLRRPLVDRIWLGTIWFNALVWLEIVKNMKSEFLSVNDQEDSLKAILPVSLPRYHNVLLAHVAFTCVLGHSHLC